jgi:hypothetical protein
MLCGIFSTGSHNPTYTVSAGPCISWHGCVGPRQTFIHVTHYLLFFDKACTAFCTYSIGSHDTPRTLPKSPRRLRILAKACSSRKSHIHCAAPRGVRVDQRLVGEITYGTSKNARFYKVLTTTGGRGENLCFITFLSMLPICCTRMVKAKRITRDVRARLCTDTTQIWGRSAQRYR